MTGETTSLTCDGDFCYDDGALLCGRFFVFVHAKAKPKNNRGDRVLEGSAKYVWRMETEAGKISHSIGTIGLRSEAFRWMIVVDTSEIAKFEGQLKIHDRFSNCGNPNHVRYLELSCEIWNDDKTDAWNEIIF